MIDTLHIKSEKKIKRGQRLAQAREYLGHKNVSAFARELGMEQGSYRDVEVGKNDISTILADKLVSQYKVNLVWIFTGQGDILLDSDFYVGGEPTQEQIDTLFDYVISKRDINLTAQQAIKLKLACARCLLENVHLRTLTNFSIAADIYLNFILKFPNLTL